MISRDENGDSDATKNASEAYLSLPIAYTSPSRLAALGALHGMHTPDAECAHVLELGCASGGNLIPLAARFPRARFVGIDTNAEQIAAGMRRASSLGLSNIELSAADIATFDAKGASFDFIICHGVFSWVPETVRVAILRLCAGNLQENGLAAISFNTLPGWRAQQIVRDLCLRSADASAAPDARVAKALETLRRVADGLTDETPYGLAVRNAAKRLSQRPASYVLGEFLATENTAFFFDEFATRLASFGLHYLCDGEFAASVPEAIAPKGAALLRAQAGDDSLRLEASLDVFSGRTFRRAVIAKTKANSAPRAAALETLHVSSRLVREKTQEASVGFRDESGARIQVTNPELAAAIDRLAAAYPATLTLADLGARDASAEDRAGLRASLLRLAGAGRAHLSFLPLHVGRAGDPRPRAFALSQLEASSGQKWVSSLTHAAVPLSENARAVLAAMDGDRDLAALARATSQSEGEVRKWLGVFEREGLIEPGASGSA